MKTQIKEKLYKFIKCGGITAIISAIIILCAIIGSRILFKREIEFIDWTIFMSIVVAMLMESLSRLMGGWLQNKLEDDVKLTKDYEKLSDMYMNQQLIYDNSTASIENLKIFKKINKKDGLRVKIPAICEYVLQGNKIKIDDCKEDYHLPEIILEQYDEIFAAHTTSGVFNQLNIRINGWEMQGDELIVKTGRTTFYNSLVTNRAMDFHWKKGMSVRELFECGPYVNSLENSKLSNHIGFNGFIESSDGYTVFVKRNKQLSIGKRTYGSSVGASLKSKYALNSQGVFTEEGLANGINREIMDELKIPMEQMDIFSAEKNLIAAYRDLVEGGKPQFLVVIQTKWTKEEIQKNFEKNHCKSQKKDLIEDGSKLLWVATKELPKVCIRADMMIHKGKKYHIMPSVAASIILYIQHLKKE